MKKSDSIPCDMCNKASIATIDVAGSFVIERFRRLRMNLCKDHLVILLERFVNEKTIEDREYWFENRKAEKGSKT